MKFKNISEIESENIRYVSVPLEIHQIKEFFENKNLFFAIDYSQSKIKGNMFLTYLSNLDLPCDIILTDVSTQEKFDILKIYMETRNISTSNVLRYAAAQVVLENKGVSSLDLVRNPILTKEECDLFKQQNHELIKKWDLFISSTLLFMLKTYPDLNEHYRFDSAYKTINDSNYIGSNVVNLFSIPFFMELFFSVPANEEVVYFKAQFEEYMFRGKNLFEYFDVPENTMIALFSGLLLDTIQTTDLEKLKNIQ